MISTKRGRYKTLRPLKEQIFTDLIEHGLRISEIAAKYSLHYSNLRRFIKDELKEDGIDDIFNIQHLNIEDFPYLEIGHSFQFADWLTSWRVVAVVEREGEMVFELVPSSEKSQQYHWVCGSNTPEEAVTNET